MKKFPAIIFCLLVVSCAVKDKRDAWIGDWEVIAAPGEKGVPSTDWSQFWIKGEVLPGKHDNRPYYNPEHPHVGVLELHPFSEQEPARISFTGTVPMATPVLEVVAGGNVHGDGVLECVINGNVIGSYVLDGSTWTTCRFDLSGNMSYPARLELLARTGGSQPWHFEHIYIDDIRFTQRR